MKQSETVYVSAIDDDFCVVIDIRLITAVQAIADAALGIKGSLDAIATRLDELVETNSGKNSCGLLIKRTKRKPVN